MAKSPDTRSRGLSSKRRQQADVPLPASAGALLIDAIHDRDIPRAQGLLMAKVDPNALRDSLGRGALQLAAAQGVVGLCRVLISHGAQLDATEAESGLTALHLSVMGGHNLLLKVLLEAKASPNAVSGGGETPLTLSINDGNLEAMKLLVQSGAQADAPGAPSALLRAIERETLCELVEHLVKAAADLNVRDDNMNGPLHLAIDHGDARSVRFLLESRADPDAQNKFQRAPLHAAAGMGASRVIRMLAERRADMNSEDGQGLTPLQLAGNSPTRRQLIDLGAREVTMRKAISMAGGDMLTLLSGSQWAGGPTDGGVFPAGRLRIEGSAIGSSRQATLKQSQSLPQLSPKSGNSSPTKTLMIAKQHGARRLPKLAWSGGE